MIREYETTILRSSWDLEKSAEEWRDFLHSRAEPHPLAQHPVLVRLFLRQEGKNRSPRIVIVRRDGVIRCVAPFFEERERFRLRFSVLRLLAPRVRLLRLLGDSPVFARDADTRGCLDAVWSVLDPGENGFDPVAIENLAVPSPLWDFVSERDDGKRRSFRLFRTSPKMEKARQPVLPESHEAWRRFLGGRPDSASTTGSVASGRRWKTTWSCSA